MSPGKASYATSFATLCRENQLRNDRPVGEEPPRQEKGTPAAREAIELLSLVVAPATLLTALLFYFGWARSRAQAAYFGIDADVLGRSSQEYVLRSISSIFWPLTLLLAGILLALATHEGAKRLAAARRVRLLVLLAVCAVVSGAALIVLGILRVVWHPRSGGGAVLTPIFFAIGIPLAAYALLIALSVASNRHAKLTPLPRAPLWLIGGLFSLFVFWTIGNYATFRGKILAERTAAHLKRLPSVTVYSPRRLYLDGLGVEEKALSDADGAYRFSYSGLRLLARSGTRTFLLPEGWCRKDVDETCRKNGVTFVLQDDSALRLDFAPGPATSRA
jgi:hypothetical protein